MISMNQLLKKLAETPGPPGEEGAVRALIRSEVELMTDDIRTDTLGNLIVHKGPSRASGGGARILLTARMDESGMIASHIDANGFVRFLPVGALDSRYLPSRHVVFLNGTRGVIGSLPPRDGETALERMFIDVGATNARDCRVRIGDMAVLERSCHEIGDRLAGQALGERACPLVLIQTLRTLRTTPHDVFLIFAAQGAVGSRGLRTASYGVEPEIAIAIGSIPAQEASNLSGQEPALGRGPVINIRGSTALSDPRLVSWVIRTAEKAHIPLQRATLDGENMETLYLETSRSGVAAATIGIPVRYRGSSSEMIVMDDLTHASRLLVALLRATARLEQ